MSRVAFALGVCACLVVVTWSDAAAQTPRPTRRLANVNVMLFGAGGATYDHPNFDDGLFPGATYQRRIWRREMRRIPIWVRMGVNFLSEDRRFYGYTVWQEADSNPFTEDVLEHTSDFTFRGEMLADVLHGRNFALYAGGGFGLHYLSFSSNGEASQIPIFSTNDNRLAPSAAVGARFFTGSQPLTLYGEIRYLAVYGKTTRVLSEARPYLTDQIFEFTRENAWSFEGGLGFHW
jgi:hypothetical protein